MRTKADGSRTRKAMNRSAFVPVANGDRLQVGVNS
jgi:hypothetical protein